MYSARSNTVTVCPQRFSCCAAASPAGPDPTTATLFPVRLWGGSGLIHPSSQPLSLIAFSMYSMVTGSWLMDSTHAASHGAGHILPVNSGKLFVLCNAASAASHSPL